MISRPVVVSNQSSRRLCPAAAPGTPYGWLDRGYHVPNG